MVSTGLGLLIQDPNDEKRRVGEPPVLGRQESAGAVAGLLQFEPGHQVIGLQQPMSHRLGRAGPIHPRVDDKKDNVYAWFNYESSGLKSLVFAENR